MTTVLIVDDSAVARQSMAQILADSRKLDVISSVGSGEEALSFLSRLKSAGKPLPKVIVLDIVMPGMDGLETTQRIMETTPLPIVIVSSGMDIDSMEMNFRALRAGAVAFVQKVPGTLHPEYGKKSAELRQLVESMAAVPVIRRWRRSPAEASARKASAASLLDFVDPPPPRTLLMVAIGASTGGPIAIQELLGGLRKDFPLPVLIVQHIAAGFVHAMAEWMSKATGLPVSVPEDGELPHPGHVYLAPDDMHMVVSADLRIHLLREPTGKGRRPSVSRLFESVATYAGRSAVGILLTGMGEDGAAELKLLRNSGSLTIAQNRESSIVYGMPGMAEKLDAADYFMAPADIASFLNNLVNRRLSAKRM